MPHSTLRPLIGLLLFALALSTSFSLSAQDEAKIKSVKSIYNRADQAKINLEIGSQHLKLMVDQSKSGLVEKLNKANFEKLVADGKVPVLQPSNLKTTTTENEILVLPKKPLPDQISLFGRTYHKVRVEFESDNDKTLVTEVYTDASTDIATAAKSMNFQWNSLGVDKTCKNPVCLKIKMINGKEHCVKIRCGT